MGNIDEINAKMNVINWVLEHIQELEFTDQLMVALTIMKLSDTLEPIYAKYNGKVFYVDLGGDEDAD